MKGVGHTGLRLGRAEGPCPGPTRTTDLSWSQLAKTTFCLTVVIIYVRVKYVLLSRVQSVPLRIRVRSAFPYSQAKTLIGILLILSINDFFQNASTDPYSALGNTQVIILIMNLHSLADYRHNTARKVTETSRCITVTKCPDGDTGKTKEISRWHKFGFRDENNRNIVTRRFSAHNGRIMVLMVAICCTPEGS